ncbi:MAG: hypothetical protein M3R38_08625 [Actinomycetota bacterium]|nr:hypothetical protein [Actinomycetota bacterium]
MDRQGCGEGPNEVRSVIASTVGGVMTKEAGAVTGDLEVTMRAGSGDLGVLVRYAGADEWYTVEGSPIALLRSSGSSDPELLKHVVEHLKTPERLANGNEEPTSLLSFPS